jgi:putative transposase
MSLHSYSRCWLHVIWATLKREGIFDKSAGAKVSAYLTEYAETKGIYMRINYVNADHVHALIDLPTKYSLEDAMQYLKGGTSFWINEKQVVCGKFSWGRGYGAFSVSESSVPQVAHYIAGQEEHHRKKSFLEEFQALVSKHSLQWRDDEKG